MSMEKEEHQKIEYWKEDSLLCKGRYFVIFLHGKIYKWVCLEKDDIDLLFLEHIKEII